MARVYGMETACRMGVNSKPTSSAESPISSIEFSSFFHLHREKEGVGWSWCAKNHVSHFYCTNLLLRSLSCTSRFS